MAMTKDQLIEAMAGYPGDTPVVVAVGFPGSALLKSSDYTYLESIGGPIIAHSVADHPDAIVLEL